MNLKIIIIVVLGIFLLVGIGYASYYGAKFFIPDPTVYDKGKQVAIDNKILSLDTVKKLSPRDFFFATEGDVIKVSWASVEDTTAKVYVTSNSAESLEQVIKDFKNGVPSKGFWLEETNLGKEHSVSFPKSKIEKDTKKLYFFIIAFYKVGDKTYGIPYGQVMNYKKGPETPYLIEIR